MDKNNKEDLNIIKNSIRSYYRNRYQWPLLYLVILLVLLFLFPILSLLFPTQMSNQSSLTSCYKQRKIFGEYTLNNVYFTGYTSSWMGQTRGYYYYASINDSLAIILLDPQTCEQGNPIIKEIHFSGKIMKRSKAVNLMLTYLADDLSWSDEGIFNTVSPYVVSEPDATGLPTFLVKFIYVGSMIFTILAIIFHTIFYIKPQISPAILNLHRFGAPFTILAEAEEELATLPQLASDDIYITQNYFIRLGDLGVAIVPIRHIIWVYKSAQSKRFLWHKYNITYTLHVVADKHHEVICPANSKSNTDGIIDYLTEANHSIITEFSEESRIKAERIQNAKARHIFRKFIQQLKFQK